tara:strand:- start:708 stop:1688 length:981 start_codon:yes stop_codon:yes gene_type:complete
MSVVNDTVLTYLPPKRKQTPSGWTAFNAPCCQHNGTTADTRQRGGLISNADGVSYHCFNCGYKASWQQGRNLSVKMRKLLQWLNAPDDVINKLALTVMQENEGIQVKQQLVEVPKFNTVPLPLDAVSIAECSNTSDHFAQVVNYMKQRKLFLEDYNYYWSPSLGYRDRLIIPFYYEDRVVGWTARSVNDNKKVKYLSEQQPGYVFNLDDQRPAKIFVIVCEGPIDAIHIEGVALLGSEAKDQQALLINRLNKDVIVVPDRDKAGSKLVEQAIDFGWGVSLPPWGDNINDIGDAVEHYGRIFTLHSIVSHAETSPLKIRLGAKKWFI